jgi:hypothetical protein
MKIRPIFLLFKTILLALFFVAGAVNAQVAKVVELVGTAQAAVVLATVPGQAAPPAGPKRNLRMGDSVFQGETINTGDKSRLVLRFDDGQIVALVTNSAFKIDAYTYNRMEPAKSNVLISLIDGGMRAITGLIGKARPESVSYRAGNATIGIRGTDVVIGLKSGKLVVSVVAGKISFTVLRTDGTKAGESVTINAGQGTYLDYSTVANDGKIGLVLSSADALAAMGAAASNGNVVSALMEIRALDVELRGGRATLFGRQTNTIGTLGAFGNAGGQTAGTGGGGTSTLPNCSIISPVEARNPGRNCIGGQ